MFLIALIPALLVLWLLFANWQFVLIGLGIWAVVRIYRAAVPPRGREVIGELPAPDYLPRWTPRRRMDAEREHAQWLEWFDAFDSSR